MKSEDLSANYHMFSGVLKQCQSTFDTLEKEVAHKKLVVKYKDDIIGFLELMQAKEHEKIVGKFEKWLTALFQDVFQKDNQIKLNLHTDYHKTGLDIFIEKEGFPEDIYKGNGGALTNLIATGLRLISVAVTHRNFLVLDEPDCWMREDLLPRFFKTISQYSRELGIQVLLITHHPVRNLADKEFFLEHDGVKTFIKEEEDIYQGTLIASNVIKSIELTNWMQYEKEIFNLSAGVNLVCGENNIGKSGFLQALRCIFYNENPQSFIRHGHKEAIVKISFIKNTIIFKANQSKTNYVRWELYDNSGELIQATEGSRNFPDWLSQFNIGKIEDIDLQLANQKDPASILAASPHVRATLLSLNKESSYAQKMLDFFKKEYRQANEFVKTGENELTQLKNKLQYKNLVDNLGLQCQKLKASEEQTEQMATFLEKQDFNLDIWTRGLGLNFIFPEIQDLQFLDFTQAEKKLFLWQVDLYNTQYQEALALVSWDEPKVQDFKNEEYKSRLWSKLNYYLQFYQEIEKFAVPEMANFDYLNKGQQQLDKLEAYQKQSTQFCLEIAQVEQDLLSVENEMEELRKTHVAQCPNCGYSLNEKDLGFIG